MKITFSKYHGAGNDFIIVDNRCGEYASLSENQIKRCCDRHFGIGADGLITIVNSEVADFEMHYFNSGGHLGTLCGNGSRCAVVFAKAHGIVGNSTRFMAIDGLHTASINKTGTVRLKMNDVSELTAFAGAVFLDTGSPHHVMTVSEIDQLDVAKLGPEIRYSDRYAPDGVDVNFVKKIDDSHFKVRTYERGVENETMACGTGAVAVALAMHFQEQTPRTDLVIEAMGGKLEVEFSQKENGYDEIYLTGPAEFVFSGVLPL